MSEKDNPKVYPVDSREHMLKPQDIFAVAAHEDKANLERFAPAAKKAGVSPERMLYSVMIKQYSNPALIRIRAGNTLFTIAAFPGRVGFVVGYNADIAPNYINNLVDLFMSARKMGFDMLLAHTNETVVRALKAALRRGQGLNIKHKFDMKTGAFAITTDRAKK